MHINELLSENQIDELSLGDVGKGIEKGIGGLAKGVGYVAGIPGGIAQKFQQGKARATAGIGGTMAQQPVQAKQPNPAYTQALQNYQQYGTATAPAGAQPNVGQDPKVMRQQAAQLRKQASDLEKQAQQAQQARVNAPPATPASTTPPAPSAAPATPASTTPPAPSAAPATPASTTPPAPGGKMTQAQQNAMKAKLQSQRQAGKSTAAQTSSGFKNYVGGSGEKMTGVDASGAPVFKKIQRENIEFYSNFLGKNI